MFCRIILFPISPQRVRFLAVHCVVADQQLLLRHPQRQHHPHHKAYYGSHHRVPPDDEGSAGELLQDLDTARAAVYGAAGVGDGEEEAAELRLGEDAGEDAAEVAGDGVGVEDAESVVDVVEKSPALVEDHHGEPWDAAGENAHDYGRPSLNKSCSFIIYMSSSYYQSTKK